MSRQEDFIEAGIQYRMEHGRPMAIGGGHFAEMAKGMNRTKPFEAGAEYGYQYAQTHPNWISVEDELPKADGRYIIADKYGGVEQMNFDAESKYWWLRGTGKMSDFVTHWMPMPQPPRKEE